MTIEKGQPWGDDGTTLAPEGVLIRSDAEARAVVERAWRAGEPAPELGLLGGDLCRTVGGRGDERRLHDGSGVGLPIDVGVAVLDGEEHRFVAHVVARRSWWRGRVVAVMNAQWIGAWDVAPKSHPNDGLLDVFDGAPSIDDRLKIRSRLLTGTHVPHPAIAQQRTPELELDLGRPTPIWLDGERVGIAQHLALRCEPDALRAVV